MDERLDRFQRPSRYVGGEVNAVLKDEAKVDLRVALAFPEVYEIGMSHLGLKILYGLINQEPRFWAERVMAPWLDREADLRQTGRPLTSLESGRPLGEFDLLGFSLQYELTYTNVLNMLDLAGLPLLARERGPKAPLVVGGGPCAFNPEPLAEFFDFFFLGDAEAGLMELLREVAAWKKAGGSKAELLASLAGRPGVYVPSFFEPSYDRQGRLREVRPLRPGYDAVRRAVVPDLNQAYFPLRPVVPLTKPVHDRLALEIARGCSRGCRFCQAGIIYRPVRERRPERVLDLAAQCLAATGSREASFLSLSAGDYACLPQLITAFMDRYAPEQVALSLPSLRVKGLSPTVMQQLSRVRKTGFTLAPEAATPRLRRVINKDLDEEELVETAREAFSYGWRLIKLYFMIGLPTETEAEVRAIADLARRVRAGTRGQVNVSFATFVPKAHTPFMWEAMLDLDQMRARQEMLLSQLKGPGLRPKWNQPASSLLEGLLARGDRRLGPVLRAVHRRGARFEGWTENLRLDLWLAALAEAGLDPEEYLRARDPDEVLPWAHLKTGVTKDFFWSEREKAYQGRSTPDCREGECTQCGVCDSTSLWPRLCDPDQDCPPAVRARAPAGPAVRFWINYAKEGPARHLSHLETMEVFVRGLRRAGLTCRMSQGFHPLPRLSFATPLPVGLASRDEYAQVELLGPPPPDQVAALLEANLARGFSVRRVRPAPGQGRPLRARGARFRVKAPAAVFDPDRAQEGVNREAILVTKKGKKGQRCVDLKPLLGSTEVLTPRLLEITLFSGANGSVRPQEAVAALFELSPEMVAPLEVVKLETLLAEG